MKGNTVIPTRIKQTGLQTEKQYYPDICSQVSHIAVNRIYTMN